MAVIEILLNGAGATYEVEESAEEVNKQLHHVKMGYKDFLEFENALEQGTYKIEKLVITPSNCAVIEVKEGRDE